MIPPLRTVAEIYCGKPRALSYGSAYTAYYIGHGADAAHTE